MADYQKMYVTLMDAVEKALHILETNEGDARFLCARAIAELTRGELACEEIYIESEEEK